MAIFKVGQRVRVIHCESKASNHEWVGREAVIVAIPSRFSHLGRSVEGRSIDCDIRVDGSEGVANFAQLAPLNRARKRRSLADTWADEKVRQVTKPQHTEPVAPKLREPVQ